MMRVAAPGLGMAGDGVKHGDAIFFALEAGAQLWPPIGTEVHGRFYDTRKDMPECVCVRCSVL
jgi:hypothetical protein